MFYSFFLLFLNIRNSLTIAYGGNAPSRVDRVIPLCAIKDTLLPMKDTGYDGKKSVFPVCHLTAFAVELYATLTSVTVPLYTYFGGSHLPFVMLSRCVV